MKRIKKLFILIMVLSNLICAQEIIWKHTGGPMGGIVGGMDISSNGDIYAGVYPFLSAIGADAGNFLSKR